MRRGLRWNKESFSKFAMLLIVIDFLSETSSIVVPLIEILERGSTSRGSEAIR
jgi:hypothetical protein